MADPAGWRAQADLEERFSDAWSGYAGAFYDVKGFGAGIGLRARW